jgi:hypothetical protein
MNTVPDDDSPNDLIVVWMLNNEKIDTPCIGVTNNLARRACQRSILDAVFMDGRDNGPAMTSVGVLELVPLTTGI